MARDTDRRASESVSWPDPARLQGELPPLEAMRTELMPQALRPLIEDAAQRMQAPEPAGALGGLWSISERALQVLQQDTITPERSRELREIVPRLKREVRSEYKRTSLISVQEQMSRDELAYYLPAIHGSYIDSGLSTLRTEAKPRPAWHETIEAANAKLKYYLHQLGSEKENGERP